MFFEKKNFPPVKAVVLSEDEGNVSEIDLDISTNKNEIVKILKGTATFIGQWPELDVVIVKCRESVFELMDNQNRLPAPFRDEKVKGPILLVRMDENSEPKNFTLKEYLDEFQQVSQECKPRRSERLSRT